MKGYKNSQFVVGALLGLSMLGSRGCDVSSNTCPDDLAEASSRYYGSDGCSCGIQYEREHVCCNKEGRCIPGEETTGDRPDPSDENPETPASDIPYVAVASLAAYRAGAELCLGCPSSCASISPPEEQTGALGITAGEPHRVMWNYINRMNGVLREPEEYGFYQILGEDGPRLNIAGNAGSISRPVPWPEIPAGDCKQMEETMSGLASGSYTVSFQDLPPTTEGVTATSYRVD